MEHNRRPANLPKKEEIEKVKNKIESDVKKYSEKTLLHPSHYVAVRRCVLSKLIVLNGRRVNEIPRLTINQLKDAFSDVWVPSKSSTHFLAYVTGKNSSKIVDIIIPVCLKKLLTFLISEVRKQVGINESNDFVFASTRSSKNCSGFHDLLYYSNKAGVNLRSTQIRHYISTLRAESLQNSNTEDNVFLEHMGHSKEINHQVYQVPRGKETIENVGSFLESIYQVEGNFVRSKF